MDVEFLIVAEVIPVDQQWLITTQQRSRSLSVSLAGGMKSVEGVAFTQCSPVCRYSLTGYNSQWTTNGVSQRRCVSVDLPVCKLDASTHAAARFASLNSLKEKSFKDIIEFCPIIIPSADSFS